LKKLLIIEDDITTLTLMGYIFEPSEFEIVESRKPIPISEIVILNPNIIVIDCFLDDGESGEEMCVKIKSDSITKNIPVILMSLSPNLKTIAQQWGANTYIAKPFDLDDFMKVVKELAL
jgi:DNA-binding response OmpR family regulator